MSRLSGAALVLAFAALTLGLAGPAVDPAVLNHQLAFAGRATETPEPARPEAEPRLRDEAARWIARKLRERNDRADLEAGRAPVAEPPGPLGDLAAYVVPATILLALLAIALAVADWLRTRALRPNLAAGVTAAAAIVVPFAWSAIAAGLTFAAVLVFLAIIGNVLG